MRHDRGSVILVAQLSFGSSRVHVTLKSRASDYRSTRDRDVRCRIAVFECYRKRKKALMSIIAEMYVQGESTTTINKLVVALCRDEFSSSTVSNRVSEFDTNLWNFAVHRLDLTSESTSGRAVREGECARRGADRRRTLLMRALIGVSYDQ